MTKMITHNAQETMDFALDFTSCLKGGEVLALHGDLGSGKTTFVKGLAEGLKINDIITSPTFVLLKEYKILEPHTNFGSWCGGSLVHVDAYRAESIDDIKSVGIEDYLNRDDVILVIEWAEKIKEILPKESINIYFNQKGENEREIIIDSNH